jgi:hypothetical protein
MIIVLGGLSVEGQENATEGTEKRRKRVCVFLWQSSSKKSADTGDSCSAASVNLGLLVTRA